MGTATVGRKKKPEGEKTESVRRPVGVNIKGNVEWREWVERAAAHDRLNVSAFVDRAIEHYARHIGFTEPPPPR